MVSCVKASKKVSLVTLTPNFSSYISNNLCSMMLFSLGLTIISNDPFNCLLTNKA